MKNRFYPFSALLAVILVSLLSISCDDPDSASEKIGNMEPRQGFQCDTDNGGLTLPDGFCAAVVADYLGIVRHIAVHENGTIYASQRHRNLNVGGLLALSDEDGDGRMDSVQRISDKPGIGLKLHGEYLYFASDKQLFRYRLSAGRPLAEKKAEIIVKQFPYQIQHSGKPFTLDNQGDLYVNIGSKSNACQSDDRRAGSPGLDPCPELASHAGIWRFSGHELNQDFSDGYRYASGVRNAYAIGWHPDLEKLFVTQHGRDQLHELWPEHFSEEQGRQLPAEELMEVEENGFYGWPYCYYDQIQGKRLLAPEYGGDGIKTGRCEKIKEPIIAFPGHFGPNDLVIYQGELFPESYRGGAFIVFHGAYYKNANERTGYQVVFVEREGQTLSSDWQVFADNFAGREAVSSAEDAEYRPIGVATGADGSLYIADSVQGRIWRVIYKDKQAG